jgi:hypothetical protein
MEVRRHYPIKTFTMNEQELLEKAKDLLDRHGMLLAEPRPGRTKAILRRRAAEIRRHCGGCQVSAFQTPHVVFLLATQDRHAANLEKQAAEFQKRWEPDFTVIYPGEMG